MTPPGRNVAIRLLACFVVTVAAGPIQNSVRHLVRGRCRLRLRARSCEERDSCEVYFNKIAADRGLGARATYRGVNPQAELSTATLNALRQDGLAPPDQRPTAITDKDVQAATVIFSIGCTLPAMATVSGKAAGWDDVPDDQGYPAMRDAIKRHVEQLVDELLAKERHRKETPAAIPTFDVATARSRFHRREAWPGKRSPARSPDVWSGP